MHDYRTRQLRNRKIVIWLLVVLVVSGLGLTAFKILHHEQAEKHNNSGLNPWEEVIDTVTTIRLDRSVVPSTSLKNMDYRHLFDDKQGVQLPTAQRLGLAQPLDDSQVDDNTKLVEVGENRWYAVDQLYHSHPYLIPEARMLLEYIGRRFNEILKEECGRDDIKPIVTSMLRTKSSVKKLRRRNGNATENSCHLYGTTFDITYSRFRTSDGDDIAADETLKAVLGKALYELRYEGLCYVKHEVRQPCFHITVKSDHYSGERASIEETYLITKNKDHWVRSKAVKRKAKQAVRQMEQTVIEVEQKVEEVEQKVEQKIEHKQAPKKKENTQQGDNYVFY